MKRRRWLQTVLSAPAVAALPAAAAQEPRPREEFAPLALGTPEPVAERGRAFFTDDEFSALTHLARTIFPSIDGRPGAIEARTPEFLDFLIGQSPGSKQASYRDGLAGLNAGGRFADRSPAEAAALLEPLTRAGSTSHFLHEAKDDIIRATFNSRAWNERSEARRGGGSGTYYLPSE
jgi:Gluconate 2-dehydrogenase subunit 3